MNESDIPQVALATGEFLQNWTLPFLDRFHSPADVIEAERVGDQRVMRDRNQIWRVIVATLLEAGPTAASELAEEHFSTPGLKVRYEKALQYLNARRQN